MSELHEAALIRVTAVIIHTISDTCAFPTVITQNINCGQRPFFAIITYLLVLLQSQINAVTANCSKTTVGSLLPEE